MHSSFQVDDRAFVAGMHKMPMISLSGPPSRPEKRRCFYACDTLPDITILCNVDTITVGIINLHTHATILETKVDVCGGVAVVSGLCIQDWQIDRKICQLYVMSGGNPGTNSTWRSPAFTVIQHPLYTLHHFSPITRLVGPCLALRKFRAESPLARVSVSDFRRMDVDDMLQILGPRDRETTRRDLQHLKDLCAQICMKEQ